MSESGDAKSITSDANPNFRRWLRIAESARGVREEGRTLAEGVHLAQTASDHGIAIESVLIRRGAAAPEVRALLQRLPVDAPRYELAAALYDRLAPVERSTGLMLVLPLPEATLPVQLAEDAVLLDGVQDPGNVGAILRTAAAAGICHVLATTGTASLWSPKVVRAAMGAHFHLKLCERVSEEQAVQALAGPWLAAVAHGGESLWETALDAPAVGWIFGGEGAGVSAPLLARANAQVYIPVSSGVESLNVAAAAAICLFERRRRERQ